MDTEKNINDDILFLAEKLSYNNNLLIKQCENWLSEEAGNRNMEKRIEERRKIENLKINRSHSLNNLYMKKKILQTIILLLAMATTQVNARTFLANDFTSYKTAVDAICANNSGEDTIRITGNIMTTALGLGITGDVTIIGDTNPDGTPKYMLDSSQGASFYCSPQHYCTIENVMVTNAGTGIEVSLSFVNNCRVKIDNCIATNNTENGIYVHVNTNTLADPYQQSISITNCISTNSRNGIYVDGQVLNSKDFMIANCVCNNNSNNGIAFGAVDNLYISNCVTNENGGNGINASYYPLNVTIDNCLSDGNKGDGFQVGISSSDKKGLISNSIATNNLGNGFTVDLCLLTSCTANKNGYNGFNGNEEHAIFDKCLSMNNGYLETTGYNNNCGFKCVWGGVISNSTAINNVGAGFNTGGGCVINCTFSNNSIGVYDDRGRVYNSIIHGNNKDFDCWYYYSEIFYNTVSDVTGSISAINCSNSDPKLQGKTAFNEDTNSPYLTACYALGAGSPALGFADKSLITADSIVKALPWPDDPSYTGWYYDMLTPDYINSILMYDQMGCVRSFAGNKYDAGAIAGDFCGVKIKKSIVSYSPKRAANYGVGSILFYGSGFNEHTKITLKKAGETDIIADTVVTTLTKCTATFNFDQKKTGVYDIVVDFGDDTITLKNGFQIEEYIEPAIDVDILAPSNIRNGGLTTYTVKYTNLGNTNIYLQPVVIELITSKELTVDVKERWEYIFSEGLDTTQCRYANIDGAIQKLDSLNDLTGADKYSTFLAPMIPVIPPYGTGYLTFDAKIGRSDIANEQIDIKVHILPPMIDQATMESMPKDGNDPFWNCMGSAAQTISDLGWEAAKIPLGLIPGVSCGLQSVESLATVAKDESAGSEKVFNASWEMGKVISECASNITPLGTGVKTAIKFFKFVSTANDMVEHATDLINTYNDCFNTKGVSPWIVGSHDPNDKYGPISDSGSKWFSDRTDFPYIISFENDPKAGASAQEVWVTDTLDLNVFDINTFEAGIIKIGSKIIETPPSLQNYRWTVDMNPEMNLITEVNLQLDKETGIAQWYFKSIDPETGLLPEDALAGFLPPDDDNGSGQGFVSFTIKPKDGLADDATVANKASIVFDNNPEILTPEWVNQKDIVPPTSKMLQPQPAADKDNTVELKWQGEDNPGGSGVYSYDIYMKRDDGSYEKVLSKTLETTAKLTVDNGVKYEFYTIATDSAGNVENKVNVPDITATWTGVKEVSKPQPVMITPNPARSECIIAFDVEKSGNSSITLLTTLGAEAMKIYDGYTASGRFQHTFNIGSLPTGMYAVLINTSGKVMVEKLLIVR